MLVTEDMLFVHAPKTGGVSVTEYLIWNLPGPKQVIRPMGGQGRRPMERLRDVARRVTYVDGDRHASLGEAVERLRTMGRTLEELDAVLAVVRDPYDLEVSRFGYYARSYHQGLSELARSGDFDRFVREAGYPWGPPRPIEEWYTIDGEMPPNMRLLRFEQIGADLRDAMPRGSRELRPLRHRNRSLRGDWRSYITADNEPLLYEKYRWLFRHYERQSPVGG